jgi:hypothetical protein
MLFYYFIYYVFCTIKKYSGKPIVILIGKVTARAIGKKSPGLALGTEIFIAAGTAMYEALAANTAKTNRLGMSIVTKELNIAIIQPLKRGIIMAKIK